MSAAGPPEPPAGGDPAFGWAREPDWSEPSDRVREDAEQPAPPPSPFAALSTRPGRLVPAAFEVLTRASGDLRRASFYIGLLVAVTVAPFALLLWRVSVELERMSVAERLDRAASGLQGSINLSLIVAFIGLFVAFVESRAVAATLLAARLEGHPLPVRQAIERSRRTFWAIVRASVLTTVPLFIVQLVTQRLAADFFRGESEVSVVSAAIVSTLLLAPFVYALTAIVLGDVGAIEAVRRSVRLFRARKLAALVVALFAWSAQFLTSFGLGAGLDLVLRAADFTSLFSSTDAATTVLAGLILVVLVFAVGTLLFTVTAISLAAQVVMFLALTHVAPGLESARVAPGHDGLRFRWLTRPYLVVALVGILVLWLGLLQLSG